MFMSGSSYARVLDHGLLHQLVRSESVAPTTGQLWTGAIMLGVMLSLGGSVCFYLGTLLAHQTASWQGALLVSGPYWLMIAVLIPPSLAVARCIRLDAGHALRGLTVHLGGAVCFAAVHVTCVALFHSLRTGDGQLIARMGWLGSTVFPLDCFVYCALIGGYYATVLYQQSKETADNLRVSRLDALRIQLAPHLLFNALNLVSVFSLKGDQKSVREIMARLSDLLRIALDEGHDQEVTLTRELEFLNIYLDIQRIQFGQRLTIEHNIASEAMDALVPRLILQPLVENAIVHGVASCPGPARIAVRVSREAERLNISVMNTGPSDKPFLGHDQRAGGIGFGNVRERLAHLYGSEHDVHFSREATGLATVRLSIPFHSSTLTGREVPRAS
jgi:two-component system, LytTR family, sensor kinase